MSAPVKNSSSPSLSAHENNKPVWTKADEAAFQEKRAKHVHITGSTTLAELAHLLAAGNVRFAVESIRLKRDADGKSVFVTEDATDGELLYVVSWFDDFGARQTTGGCSLHESLVEAIDDAVFWSIEERTPVGLRLLAELDRVPA